MTLGKLLREARKAAKMSQVEAAQKIGVSQGTVSKYERDEIEPGLFETLMITIVYNLTMARIFGALMKTKRK